MSIPIVPNKNKNLGKTASEEERQLRMLEGEGMMSQALNDQINKMAQNPNWMNQGFQDEAEIEKNIPAEDVDIVDFPRGRGFGPGPEGGGLGRGRRDPGIPGTGPREGTPACPLSEDNENNDEVAVVVEDELGEEPKVYVTEDEDVIEEIEESAEATVEGVISKMEEALSDLKGLFEGDLGSFDSMEESLEEIKKGLIGNESQKEDIAESPEFDEFKDTIVQDYFGEVSEDGRSLEDLNSRIAGRVAPISRKEYAKLAKKYSKKLTKTAQNETKRSGIPPWQYTALEAYFKGTPEAERSFENAKKWWQTTNQKGELLKENYEEAKNKFSENNKKAELVEIKLDKKASSKTDKFAEKFPELRSYSKMGNYNSGGSKKSN